MGYKVRKRMAEKQSHKKLSGKMATEESSSCLIDEKKEKSKTKGVSLKDHIMSLILWLKMFLKGGTPFGALYKTYFLSFIYRLPLLNVFLLKKDSPSSHIDRSLSLLEEQQVEYPKVLRGTLLMDHNLSLKLALSFLETFLIMSSNEELKMRIKRVLYKVGWELHSFSYRLTTNERLILHMNRVYTNLRENMKDVIIKQETKDCDAIFPKLTSSTDLRKINDFLLQSIWELSGFSDSLFPSLREKIDDIKEMLILLQALLTNVAVTIVPEVDENRKLLTPVVELHEKIACLLYLSLVVGGMDEQMELGVKLSALLEKFKVIKIHIVALGASLYEPKDDPLGNDLQLDILKSILDCIASSRIDLKDLSEKIYGELKYFKYFCENLPPEEMVENFKDLVTTIKAISWKLLLILNSCYEKDMASEVKGALLNVFDQIKHNLKELIVIKLNNYPETDELGFMDLFLGHLKELLDFGHGLTENLKDQIEILHVDFDFLRSFLGLIKEQRNEHEELKDIWTCIMHLAYQAEYVIDMYLVEYASYSRISLTLSEILEQTKLVKSKVERIDVKANCYTQAQYIPTTFNRVPSTATGTSIDVVVGFEDEADNLMEYLLADMKQRAVVSIVGMAGLGKTTLARKIYDVPRIRKNFDVQAWCSVSQTYRKRELLLSILGDVITITEDINNLNDEELAAKLYQSLKGRRYFIVIDDMWDIEAWNDLVRSLPDDRIHSRIIITSRLQNVASQITAYNKIYHLREFSEDESWELFRKKVFTERSFPREFWEVGKEIVLSCKRLPLAIVMIAGLLAKVGENIREWKQLAVNLSSHILSDSESHCNAILELSYSHLPDHLKSCFLYFGAFREDEEIPVWKLKWLWIAEGFIRNSEAKSLEDVAEEYFMNLISRSLISATKERSRGGVKACHIHDLLRDFCLKKSKEESFLHVINASNSSCFSRRYDQRRLSIYSEVCHLMEANPYGFTVRSLLHTAVWEDSYLWNESFIFQNFKLLRVLDLAFLNLRESFSGIQSLIHLKYLAIRAETDSIPSSISNLRNLQFLLIKLSRYYNYGGKVVKVPDSLWDMVNLRHVHIINRSASFSVDASRLEKSTLLDNLESLSTPCLSYGEEAENLLRRLSKLRKLRCVFMYCLDDSTNCYRFPVLDFLDQLVSLKVYFNGPASWGKKCEFNFPSNLQKLSFSNFRLSWSDISKIGKTLPNLKVLKLTGDDRENIWDMNEGDFPKLKYLKLSRLIHLQEWIASEDALPALEQLVLENCWKLDEIPPCFGEHNTLRVITVRDCKPSVDDSARTIQEEQYEELQNEDFKVYIYPRKPKSSTF